MRSCTRPFVLLRSSVPFVVLGVPSVTVGATPDALFKDVQQGLLSIMGNRLDRERSHLPAADYHWSPIKRSTVRRAVLALASTMGSYPETQRFTVICANASPLDSAAEVKAKFLGIVSEKHGAATAEALVRFLAGVSREELGHLFDKACQDHPTGGKIRHMGIQTHVLLTADTHGLTSRVAADLASRFVETWSPPLQQTASPKPQRLMGVRTAVGRLFQWLKIPRRPALQANGMRRPIRALAH